MTLSRWIASGAGIGHFPAAPGTAASLAALLIGAIAFAVSTPLLLILALAAILFGTWAIHATEEPGDPGWIVIDEVAGQWIAILGLSHVSIPGLIAAFALFRVLDIVKPGPIGWADKQHHAIGVMADDVLAGVIAAALLFATRSLIPGLNL